MPDIVWEHSQDGALGWNTGLAANPAGTYLLVGMDVSGVYIKPNDPAQVWQQVMKPGKIPSGFSAPMGLIEGCYGVDWASDTRFYFAMHDELLRGDMTGADWTITRTALTGLPVYANDGEGRRYWGKVACDRTDPNTCYVFMGAAGPRRTIDGGASFTTPTGLPAPSEPAANTRAMHGLFAVAYESSLTSGRRSRVAACPFGQGIYVSTDGGGSFTQISDTILAAASMQWRGANLYVCGLNAANQVPTNVLHKWNGTSWSTITMPAEFSGIEHLIPLPTGADDWLLFDTSNHIARTTDDFATYQPWVGGFEWGTQRQLRVNESNPRPMPAKKYRLGQGGYAISRPILVNGDILWPIGYGTLRTTYADWPVNESLYPSGFTTNMPTWTEETAGIEELVSLSTLWRGDRLYLASQDVALRVWPENGHRHAVNYYPVALTRCTGIDIGPDDSVAIKICQQATRYDAISPDGVNFAPMANQAPVANIVIDGGKIVNLGGGKAVSFSTTSAEGVPVPFPHYTADAGATPWTRCVLRDISDDEVPYASFTATTHQHGWMGNQYVSNCHRYCRDPATDILYAVNIGGSLTGDGNDFAGDPLGYAGLWSMVPSEFGTLRQITTGHPTPYGNRGYFDSQLIADGQGHLVFMNTPLEYPTASGPLVDNYLGAGATNYSKIYDLDEDGDVTALRTITTPFNLIAVAFGAPFPGDTQKALWLLGNHGGVFGLWLIRNLTTLAVTGPFNYLPANLTTLPAMASLSAHATEFGRLGIGYASMGNGRGTYDAAA